MTNDERLYVLGMVNPFDTQARGIRVPTPYLENTITS